MIYLVTTSKILFKSDNYKIISAEEALSLLEPLEIVGADSETMGLDVFTKELLSFQLGNNDFQVVWDCTTVSIQLLKPYLESNRLFIFWNAKFDLKFLYHHGIFPNNIYDGFLAEKLLWNGYPIGMHEMSLRAAGLNYLGVELDKSVRGKITKTGLTDDVVVYSAYDVKYEPAIREAQLVKLKEQGLLNAIKFENEFVKCLAYIEYCGVTLDVDKWKLKMQKDNLVLSTFENALNKWVENASTGKTTSITYIEINSLDKKELKKRREELLKIGNRSEKDDISSTCNAFFEAYEIPIQNLSPSYTTINLQGDLFTGFDTTPRCNIKWSSSKQVIPVFEELGFNLKVIDPKTKKSKKSVEAKVIEPQKGLSSLAEIYIAFKEAGVVVGTFGQSFLDKINPVTGRIHANFNQIGTDTNRLSSTEPNMQNLPSDSLTRSCFIAGSGNKWVSADYQGQESAIMASIANDKAMLEELINGSGDLHSLTAKLVFLEIPRDTLLTEIKSKYHSLRQKAKGYEFCFAYYSILF